MCNYNNVLLIDFDQPMFERTVSYNTHRFYLYFVPIVGFRVVSSYVFQLNYSCALFLKVTVATVLILSLCTYLDHSYICSRGIFLEVCGWRETLDLVFTRWLHLLQYQFPVTDPTQCATFLKVTAAIDLILSQCTYLDHSYNSSGGIFSILVSIKRNALPCFHSLATPFFFNILIFRFWLWAPPCHQSLFVYDCLVFYSSCISVCDSCARVLHTSAFIELCLSFNSYYYYYCLFYRYHYWMQQDLETHMNSKNYCSKGKVPTSVTMLVL